MRMSLYEKLKHKQLSYINELRKINDLINKDLDARYQLHESFRLSPYCVYYGNYDDAVSGLFEISSKYPVKNNRLDNLILFAVSNRQELTLNSFLDYLEFYKTLFNIKVQGVRNTSIINQIKQIIEYDCDKLGYLFVKKDGSTLYEAMLKKPEAESVALIVDKTTSDKIHEYLTIRPNQIEEKRRCLKSLIDDIENTLKDYRDINEYKKVQQFVQCVRHTKNNPIKTFPFYYENEDYWMDKTFDMVIGIISFTKTKEIINEIKELESRD